MEVNIPDLWLFQTLRVLFYSEQFCLINFHFKTLITNLSLVHYFLLQIIVIIIIIIVLPSKDPLAEQLVPHRLLKDKLHAQH